MNTSYCDAANHFHYRDPKQVGATWNYLYNDRTHVTIGPDGSGRSVFREPNILQWNRTFRWLYLRDRDSGEVWCPAWAPIGSALDEYDCCHAPAQTTIRSTRGRIRSAWRAFVPLREQAEIWTWTLANRGASRRELDAFVVLGLDDKNFMGWRCFWDAAHRVFAKYAFPHHAHYEDYERLRTRPNYVAIAPGLEPTSWAGCLDDVTGGACPGLPPDAVLAGELPSRVVSNGSPVAALHWRVNLPAGETWRVDWWVALCGDPAEAAALRDRLPVEESLAEVEAAIASDEARLILRSPDPDLDRMVNRWTKKQITWQTRLWRNGISYPLRNILQDAVGYALYRPNEALPPLRTVTAQQKSDGYLKMWTTRPGEAADHPLVHKVHNDGGIWLVLCGVSGLHAAGDLSLLDEVIPFADGGSASWYEHLLRALRFYDGELGAHGLVLMRDGDWTDPINGPGRLGRGESGWASMALAKACLDLATFAALRGDHAAVEELTARRLRHIAAIDAHLWCGTHYAYGFDDDGRRFGDDRDGRVFLNTQTWALLAGCGDRVRRVACRRAIDALDTPFGTRLLAPPFPGWDPQVGRLSIKIPGFGENGSIYCHGAAFAVAALAGEGDGAAAIDLMQRILPTHPNHAPDRSKQIPIWQPNAWFGDLKAADAGHSTEALATGTTTWLLLALVEGICGFRARIQGIDLRPPNLPPAWPGLVLERELRGCRYRLQIRRGDRLKLLIDGKPARPGLHPYTETSSRSITWILPHDVRLQ